MPYLRIDLGTTTSVVPDFQRGQPVVLPNHEGPHPTAAVVTIRRDGALAILRAHHGIFEELGSKGIRRLGGDDLDESLATYLADRFEQKTGYKILLSPYCTPFLMAVERAKVTLSGEKTAVAWAPGLVPERK